MLGSAEKVIVSLGPNKPARSRVPLVLDVSAVALLLAAMAWLFHQSTTLWLMMLVPTAAGVLSLARRARASDQAAQRAITESEEQLLEAERLARIGHWRWLSKEGVLVLSPQAATMLGRQAGDQCVNIHDVTALHSLEDEQSFLDRVRHVMATGETSSADIRVITLRGEHWLHSIIRPARDDAGAIIGVFGTLQDISARKRLEDELRALKTDLLNRIPAGVVYKAADGRIVYANRVAARFAGISPAMMIGRRLDEIYPRGDHEVARRIDEEVMRSGEPKFRVPCSGKLPDGTTRWCEMDVFPDFDANGKVSGTIVFGLDVTQRKRAEEQIAYLAMHDPLTDLCNRRLLTDRLMQALAQCTRRQRRCALLFVDLDHFKQVNDVHGHDIGDLLLVQVAQRLRDCVRAEDTVSRSGGDEFVILLSDVAEASDALTVAEKVRAALLQPFSLRGLIVKIGCSIGIAEFPEHGQTEHELMRAADGAMYAAKTSGRNTVCVSAANAMSSQHDAA